MAELEFVEVLEEVHLPDVLVEALASDIDKKQASALSKLLGEVAPLTTAKLEVCATALGLHTPGLEL
jgi:hypothetical protein